MAYYYCISYLYSEEKGGIYHYLPVTSQVTRDENVARQWFDKAVAAHTDSWRGNELIYSKDCKLDYQCRIKEAMFKCEESAYQKGYYLIELSCYTHNPFEQE